MFGQETPANYVWSCSNGPLDNILYPYKEAYFLNNVMQHGDHQINRPTLIIPFGSEWLIKYYTKVCVETDHKYTYKFCIQYLCTLTIINMAKARNFETVSTGHLARSDLQA